MDPIRFESGLRVTLQAMGCTMVQGSFTGGPVATDAVEALLDAELPAAHAATVEQA